MFGYRSKLLRFEGMGEPLLPEKTYHMSPEQFRNYGYSVVDWIANYYERIETFPVLSQVKPGTIRKALPAQAPQTGEAFESMVQDIDTIIVPGITHWQSPNFFAYFPANASGPAILGDLLSSALGVQGMLWATSPACTELETQVLDWLVPMLGLPQKFLSTSSGGGVIQDTASSSSLCAMLAARERATNYVSNRRGCDGRLVAYTSNQAHSSLEKAAMVAGIGRDNLRLVEVDEQFAMRSDALRSLIRQDRQAGLVPFFVSATVGTTSSNGLDPLPAIGAICREEGCGFMWTRPCQARPLCVLNFGIFRMELTSPTAIPSIPISGCSPTSIATASMLPTERR